MPGFDDQAVAVRQQTAERPAAWLRCILTAELQEDAHPGSGAGGAGVDALVARDRYNRPVIWASHLDGVLRDAARRLRGLNRAEFYFGGPGGTRRRFLFESLYTTGDPETRVWRSSARASFHNRAPRDETLRAIEFVSKGTCFEGRVELPADDLPMLRRLLAEADAIGHARASGSGRIAFSLTEDHSPPRPFKGKADCRLLLVLRNADPVSITATATPTNIIPTMAFIPGRSLLGAVANWLLEERSGEAASALVSGAISVSDALPLPEMPETPGALEVTPSPLSLLREKPPPARGTVPWWAFDDRPPVRVDGAVGTEFGPKLKRPEAELFVYRAGPQSFWMTYSPKIRVRLRNGRPQPAADEPSLFVIEQIVEDTFFAAELRGDPDVLSIVCEGLRPVLEGRRWLRLGRGGAPVEVVWAVWAPEPRAASVGSSAYLILTSDLLVRDERLRWLTALDGDALERLIGVKAAFAIQDSAPVHGFNGTSRLWRYPAAAVRRGSVFRIEGPRVAELARRAAEGKWLGERTNEGFGRFRLDSELPGVTPPATTSTPEKLSKPAADRGDEPVAVATQAWFQEHPNLGKRGTFSTPRPSLSQWLDLVSELEHDRDKPLTSRLHPETAGKRTWEDGDAQEILQKLVELKPPQQRPAYARMFVRWLRAAMRREKS